MAKTAIRKRAVMKQFVKKKMSPQKQMMVRPDVLSSFDEWTDRFTVIVSQKGKVQPGKHRAYGYKAPKHLLADIKLIWRSLKMQAGKMPPATSPGEQDEKNLNRDRTLFWGTSEGHKLRCKKR